MNAYFKIMTWLYLSSGILAAAMTIYFQNKGRKEEAIYCLVCVFVCGLMLGLRNWQKKRMAKLEQFLKEKHDAKQKELKNKK
jgi:hypothetical protein